LFAIRHHISILCVYTNVFLHIPLSPPPEYGLTWCYYPAHSSGWSLLVPHSWVCYTMGQCSLTVFVYDVRNTETCVFTSFTLCIKDMHNRYYPQCDRYKHITQLVYAIAHKNTYVCKHLLTRTLRPTIRHTVLTLHIRFHSMPVSLNALIAYSWMWATMHTPLFVAWNAQGHKLGCDYWSASDSHYTQPLNLKF
jgi:hypothetical protein